MQHRNTQAEFELETTVNGHSMHQCRRPIPLYCDRGKKSSHPVFAVTSVIYAFLAFAKSWFYVSVSLHVKRGAIFL
jgi:hypothetical protein